MVRSTAMHDMPARVRAGLYDVLWFDLPYSASSVPPRKWNTVVRELAVWMRAAVDCGLSAYLAAPRGRWWQHPDVQALLADNIVQEVRYAACTATSSTSPEVLHVYSSTSAQSVKCGCSAELQHAAKLAGSPRWKNWVQLVPRLHATVVPLLVAKAKTQGGRASARRPDLHLDDSHLNDLHLNDSHSRRFASQSTT